MDDPNADNEVKVDRCLQRLTVALKQPPNEPGEERRRATAVAQDFRKLSQLLAHGQVDLNRDTPLAMEKLGTVLTEAIALQGGQYEGVCREACALVTFLARAVSYRGGEWAVAIVPPLLRRLEEENQSILQAVCQSLCAVASHCYDAQGRVLLQILQRMEEDQYMNVSARRHYYSLLKIVVEKWPPSCVQPLVDHICYRIRSDIESGGEFCMVAMQGMVVLSKKWPGHGAEVFKSISRDNQVLLLKEHPEIRMILSPRRIRRRRSLMASPGASPNVAAKSPRGSGGKGRKPQSRRSLPPHPKELGLGPGFNASTAAAATVPSGSSNGNNNEETNAAASVASPAASDSVASKRLQEFVEWKMQKQSKPGQPSGTAHSSGPRAAVASPMSPDASSLADSNADDASHGADSPAAQNTSNKTSEGPLARHRLNMMSPTLRQAMLAKKSPGFTDGGSAGNKPQGRMAFNAATDGAGGGPVLPAVDAETANEHKTEDEEQPRATEGEDDEPRRDGPAWSGIVSEDNDTENAGNLLGNLGGSQAVAPNSKAPHDGSEHLVISPCTDNGDITDPASMSPIVGSERADRAAEKDVDRLLEEMNTVGSFVGEEEGGVETEGFGEDVEEEDEGDGAREALDGVYDEEEEELMEDLDLTSARKNLHGDIDMEEQEEVDEQQDANGQIDDDDDACELVVLEERELDAPSTSLPADTVVPRPAMWRPPVGITLLILALGVFAASNSHMLRLAGQKIQEQNWSMESVEQWWKSAPAKNVTPSPEQPPVVVPPQPVKQTRKQPIKEEVKPEKAPAPPAKPAPSKVVNEVVTEKATKLDQGKQPQQQEQAPEQQQVEAKSLSNQSKRSAWGSRKVSPPVSVVTQRDPSSVSSSFKARRPMIWKGVRMAVALSIKMLGVVMLFSMGYEVATALRLIW